MLAGSYSYSRFVDGIRKGIACKAVKVFVFAGGCPYPAIFKLLIPPYSYYIGCFAWKQFFSLTTQPVNATIPVTINLRRVNAAFDNVCSVLSFMAFNYTLDNARVTS